MTKKEILDYVSETPYNTNRAVLSGMLDSISEGGDTITTQAISITENGTTTAPDGVAYNEITVNVEPPVVNAIAIDMNGGTFNNKPIFLAALESNDGIYIRDWYTQNASKIVAPEGKQFNCVTTIKNDVSMIQPTISGSYSRVYYVYWADESNN